MSKQEGKEESRPVTSISEYSPTAAALHKLKTELEGKQYEVGNATGLALAKFHRRELVTLRTDLEKKRKEIKAPALARCKEIDTEAARITCELVALEDPIDKQIKEEENRKEEIRLEKERAEAARKSAIADRIDKIKDLPRIALDATDSLELEEFIAKVEARQLGADFAEFLEDAQTAKTEAVNNLNEMLANLKAKETEAARVKAEQEIEAARLEEIRVQQEKDKAEQDRLNAIEQEKLAAERAELEQLREEKRLKDEAEMKERNLAETRRLKIVAISNVALTAFNEGYTSKGLEEIISETEKTECNGDAEMLIAVDKALNDLRSLQTKRAQEEKDAAQKLIDDAAKRKEEDAAAEKLRKAEAEKREKEAADRMNALTATHLTTLQAILDMAQDETISAPAAIQGIVHLAKLGIESGSNGRSRRHDA
jgi:hypothetical protein